MSTRYFSASFSLYKASIQPNSIQFHHLEQVGDILLLDKHSFTGTMSEQLWKQLTDCPSIVNQEQPYQQSTVYALLAGLVSIYNSKRVAIQAEIDCGECFIRRIIHRTKKTKSFKDYLFTTSER